MKTKPLSRRQAVGLVFLCTLLGAAGQILIKYGAVALRGADPLAMLTNVSLMAGYSLYGLMTVLFIFALRDEELSILYPIISLTYVWVAMLSVYYFKETLNAYKLVGISVIVAGVAVLGKDGRK
jgi:multidrug transporter EmrE-like cation transporter